MSLQPNDRQTEENNAPAEDFESEYLKTLREATEFLDNGVPLSGQEDESEPAPKRKGKKFLKKKKKPWWKRLLKILVIFLIVILSMAIIATVTFLILFKVGKGNMLNYDGFQAQFPQPGESVVTVAPEFETTAPEEPTTEPERVLVYDDGKTVSYKGETYVLNENITTVLLIGVDREELDGESVRGDGGEADCILLMSMDTETGKTKIVNISREAYAQVDYYSASGTYLESKGTQLCRAFAYGDGGILSCENTVKSVKRLLYGMPIHSYVALDLRFIGAATDAVGGITLTALSDVKMLDDSILKAGTEVELWGENAERYVRYRNKKILESNLLRMDRQKQYVEIFTKKALSETKRDLSTLLDLYEAMSPYMTTGLSLADTTFLLGTFLNHGATFEFTAIQGELGRMGENAIYYLDESSVYETVLDIYYNKVEN